MQYQHIEEHTRNTTTNLLVHGYDESKKAVWADPVTGAAPLVWDRAVGWYFLSLWETLQVFPQSHAGYAQLLGYFTTLAAGLKTAQDESGGWWLIMSEPYPGAEGNYIESSASAMFVLGMLRGIRSGYIESADYLAPAQKGYNLLVDRFVVDNGDGTLNWEGTVQVGSLGSNGTYEVSFLDKFVVNYFFAHMLTVDTVLHQRSSCFQRLQGCRTIHAGLLRVGDLGLERLKLCILDQMPKWFRIKWEKVYPRERRIVLNHRPCSPNTNNSLDEMCSAYVTLQPKMRHLAPAKLVSPIFS